MRSVTVGPATTYYTYDQVGNILSHGYSVTSPEYTYTYDILNRLSTASFYGQNYSYTYDNNGNILSESSGIPLQRKKSDLNPWV